MSSKEIIDRVGMLLDLAGVLVIAGGVVIATGYFLYRYWRTRQLVELYRPYRRTVGRAILLGLEIIVGGDIIRTVAVSPTFESVGVLAVIVLVRTFLSLSLEVELEGRWPWQSRRTSSAQARPDQAG
ncbi:DUF1622 domain-containing protein [Plantactinospora sp. WMMC1484]|uniref:DUF1622 domain-containing protein n=1 Tax=Plantactinospora sp. WMMC1484 TaxID=3404122 RepID=UPI003BF5EB5C